MTPLDATPPQRPRLLAAAVILHGLWGLFVLAATGILACLSGLGSIVVTIVGVASQEEDVIPAILILGAVTLGLLLLVATSALSVFLAWKAWGMQRFWIWALMIWSIIHLPTGCGVVLTILTVIGGFQALELAKDDEG
jgi:hypothetical protein